MRTLANMLSSEVVRKASPAEGQLGEEVLAAGRSRHGKRLSTAATMTGTARFEDARLDTVVAG